METHGPISPAEAADALASAQQSRTQVAWIGYPTWYWLGAGAGMATLAFAMLLPDWIGLAAVAAVAVVLIRLAVAASRARGVCEHWTRSAARAREVVVLYGPATGLLLAGAVVTRFAWWATIATAVLVFALFAGTGLRLSARAARQ